MLRPKDLSLLRSRKKTAGVSRARGALPLLAGLICLGLILEAIPARSDASPSGQARKESATVIGQLPAGHFLENIAEAPDGSFWITDYVGRAIYRYETETGFRHHLELDVHPADVAFASDGTAFITAQSSSVLSPTYQPSNLILIVSADGTREALDGQGVFFNGITAIGDDQFIVADSGSDTLWTFGRDDSEITALLSHSLLGKSDVASFTPGANGVQLHEGHLYVSNSERAILMRFALPITPGSAPETLLMDTVIDDFTFAPDGSLIATSHGDVVFQVDLKDGTKKTLADVEGGVRGSTSAVMADQGSAILVVTDGGLFQGGDLGTANLVRVPIQ